MPVGNIAHPVSHSVDSTSKPKSSWSEDIHIYFMPHHILIFLALNFNRAHPLLDVTPIDPSCLSNISPFWKFLLAVLSVFYNFAILISKHLIWKFYFAAIDALKSVFLCDNMKF